jgi:hypothetical protein
VAHWHEVTDWRAIRFDGAALWEAMDAQRGDRGMTWKEVVADLAGSAVRGDPSQFAVNHPIAADTVALLKDRGDCGCHFALSYLTWVGRTPESFLVGVDELRFEEPLPAPRLDRRLRWDIPALADAVDEKRGQIGMTRKNLAQTMGVSVSQANLRALRYGTGMSLTMRLAQWLNRSAASFVILAKW